MNEKNYKIISDWFRAKDKRLKNFNLFYKVLPYIIVLSYLIAVVYEIFNGDLNDKLRIVLVPMITFILCTVARKLINKKRPYEVLDIVPLIKKDKQGQSFPSRHMVSAGVIAVSAMYVNVYFGVMVIVVGVFIGILRPIAGVHYIKDVIVGFLIGILCGILGFYVI